jgi:hypothetical protein
MIRSYKAESPTTQISKDKIKCLGIKLKKNKIIKKNNKKITIKRIIRDEIG